MTELEAIEKLQTLRDVKLNEVGKCGYTIAIDTLLKQLQEYKDKENNLREYIKDLAELEKNNYAEFSKDDFTIVPQLLEILNKGVYKK